MAAGTHIGVPLCKKGGSGLLFSCSLVRATLDSVFDYAIYMLDPDGFVKTWNAGAERIKGYQASRLLASIFPIFHYRGSSKGTTR